MRQATMHYKQTLKEIYQWIRRYQNVELKDNSMNLKMINQSFEQKINFLFSKFQTVEKNMENIMTDVTK